MATADDMAILYSVVLVDHLAFFLSVEVDCRHVSFYPLKKSNGKRMKICLKDTARIYSNLYIITTSLNRPNTNLFYSKSDIICSQMHFFKSTNPTCKIFWFSISVSYSKSTIPNPRSFLIGSLSPWYQPLLLSLTK